MGRRQLRYSLWKRADTGGTYYVRPAGGRWQTTGTSNRKEAVDFCEQRWGESAVEDAITKHTTLRQVLADYYRWDSCPLVVAKRRKQRGITRNWVTLARKRIDDIVLRDSIADMPVLSLRRSHIEDFVSRLCEAHHPPVVIQTFTVLRSCLSWEVHRERLAKNPCKGVENLPEHVAAEVGIFTPEELAELFATKPGYWLDETGYAFFYFLAKTGCRRGEALAVQWGDIDFDTGIVTLRRATKDSHGVTGPLKQKTPKDKRSIKLSPALAQVLREHRAASEHVLPDALVFHREDGSYLRLAWVTKRFEIAMRDAKIKDVAARRLRPHSFRHSLNSALVWADVPDRKVRAMLGWNAPAIQDRYLHGHGEHLAGVEQVIDSIF